MSTTNIAFISLFGVLYLVVAFTIGRATFKKGYLALFIIGFLIPPFWLLGALLPAKKGSHYKGMMS